MDQLVNSEYLQQVIFKPCMLEAKAKFLLVIGIAFRSTESTIFVVFQEILGTLCNLKNLELQTNFENYKTRNQLNITI